MRFPAPYARLARLLLCAAGCAAAIMASNAAPLLTAAMDSAVPTNRSSAAETGKVGSPEPLVRFGVFADVQYADKASQGPRQYRDALARLEKCLEAFNQDRLAFVVNLGDLIDGNGTNSLAEFKRVIGLFDPLKPPLYHVLGNHCLDVDRATAMRLLKLESGYYSFQTNGWRFVVLDGMDVSVKSPKGSPERAKAQEYLAADSSLPTYNGAIGAQQMQWLKDTLAEARLAQQKVIVFCHHPTLPAASDRSHLLWNHEDVLQTLETSGGVVAFICGHDHRGGYAEQNGIHHLTLPGIVEAPAGDNCCAVVEVFRDRLSIRGTQIVPSRVLRFDPAPTR